MPPPSSPENRSHLAWDFSSTSPSSSSSSDNDNGGDHSGDINSSGNQRGSRLNTLNLLSNFFLRTSRINSTELAIWRNRYNAVHNDQLHVNSIPFEIRNISPGSNEQGRSAIFVDSSDEAEEDNDDNYVDNEDDNEDDNDDDLDDIDDENDNDEDDYNYGYAYGYDSETTQGNDVRNLRSDIQSNERLLLSSARQNHTNTNTLISLNSDIDSDNGVALRRQNAIRLRSRSDRIDKNIKSRKSRLNKEAHTVYKDIRVILDIIRSLKYYPGESPIFTNHSMSHRHFVRYDKESTENLFSNLDLVMDKFLNQRRSGKLWLHDVMSLKRKIKVNNKKRKSTFNENKSNKRQKMKAFAETSMNELLSDFSSQGDNINFSSLSYGQRNNIMEVMFSSFLKDGSSFNLNCSQLNSKSIDLIFTSVDYSNKILEGIFSLCSGKNTVVEQYYFMSKKLRQFMHYFIGTGYGMDVLPRDKLLAKKIKILDHLNEDFTLDKFNNPNNIKSIKPFIIPFNGKIIDFKNNDLRFLPSISMPNNIRIRSLHLARTKSARVRLQLSEWMKIQPFKQHKETFFIQRLTKLEESLRDFSKSKLPSNLKEEHVEMGKGLRSNIFDLTKDFDFIKYRNLPVPFVENEQIKREFTVNGRKPNFFIQDWQRNLSDKLSEFITCQGYCLLNIQLNYILFTLKVDLNKLLDEYIRFILQFSPPDLVKKYETLLKNISNNPFNEESRNAILLCSLNRKTGKIEIHNTKAYLDYKNVYHSDLHISRTNNNRSHLFSNFNSDLDRNQNIDFETLFSSDDSDTDDGSNYTEPKYDDPYDEGLATILEGNIKRTASSSSIGGGNPSYGIV